MLPAAASTVNHLANVMSSCNRSYMNDTDLNDIVFERSLPMMLHGALDEVMPAYRQLFNAHGLTEQQWRVLRVLWEQPSLSSIDISRRTLIQPNSLVGLLERLEKRGYVARVRSIEDRRIVYAKLTPAGRELGVAIAPELREIHDMIGARLSTDEWAQLSMLLGKVSETKTMKEKNHG